MRFVERKKLVGGDELVQRNFKRNFDEGCESYDCTARFWVCLLDRF